MGEIPRTLLDGVATPVVRTIEEWWAALPDEARAEVVTLCDEGRDGAFFLPIPDDPSTPIPVVIGGRFIPHDDAWGMGEWGLDRFEYILDHPEQFPIWEPVFRTFHIG